MKLTPIQVRVIVLAPVKAARKWKKASRKIAKAKMKPSNDDNASSPPNHAKVPHRLLGAFASSPATSRSTNIESLSGNMRILASNKIPAKRVTLPTVAGKIMSVACLMVSASMTLTAKYKVIALAKITGARFLPDFNFTSGKIVFPCRNPTTTENRVIAISTSTIGENIYSMPSANPLRNLNLAIWKA